MKQGRVQIFLGIMVLVLVTMACGFSASTANIKDAYMARDNEGTDKTTVFGQSDIFYCIVQLANAPDDTKVKAVWYAVNVENTDPNFKIDEVETTSGDATIPFNLTNNQFWPLGTYKVEIYLNDTLDKTLDFEVQ
jgi:hypothetical protein